MPTSRSQFSRVSRRRPGPSAPRTSASGPVSFALEHRLRRLVVGRRRSRSRAPSASAASAPGSSTWISGIVSAAPDATLRTVGDRPAARSRGTMTAVAPAASAVRRQAPRLCGSCTPSSTSSSGGAVRPIEQLVQRALAQRDRSRESAGTRPDDARCRRADPARAHRAIPSARPPPAPAAAAPSTRASSLPFCSTSSDGALRALLQQCAHRMQPEDDASSSLIGRAFAPLPRAADRARAAACPRARSRSCARR